MATSFQFITQTRRVFLLKRPYSVNAVSVNYSRDNSRDPILIKNVLQEMEGSQVIVNGWARTIRIGKVTAFMEVHDGTSASGIQVVMDAKEARQLQTGCSLTVSGILKKSTGNKQALEIEAKEINVIGSCVDNPIQKKYHTMEFLRQISHLRPRSQYFGHILRLKHHLQYAQSDYFNKSGFIQVQTPIITSNDCEGGGETFNVMIGTKQFFEHPVYLTVSGQLHLEMLASSMAKVYTFGPTFRAENSNTTRHLAEFWMLEAEISFIDKLEDIIHCMEQLVLSSLNSVLTSCKEEILYFDSIKPGHLAFLENIARLDRFPRITFMESCELLQLKDNGKNGLTNQDEMRLCSLLGNVPVFVTNYPASLKPFYMRKDESYINDIPTVSCVDLLVPRVGELAGGSLREERHDVLLEQMGGKHAENGNNLNWYLDLRKYGSVPHGGFGLGFERWVQFIAGMENIRETTAFIRTPGVCPM